MPKHYRFRRRRGENYDRALCVYCHNFFGVEKGSWLEDHMKTLGRQTFHISSTQCPVCRYRKIAKEKMPNGDIVAFHIANYVDIDILFIGRLLSDMKDGKYTSDILFPLH